MFAAIVCVVLVALGLLPDIVSIGPLLPDMIPEFGLSHAQASLPTAIPTFADGTAGIACAVANAALWS
jgi:CP family cyanate transporter-like MFS transporter